MDDYTNMHNWLRNKNERHNLDFNISLNSWLNEWLKIFKDYKGITASLNTIEPGVFCVTVKRVISLYIFKAVVEYHDGELGLSLDIEFTIGFDFKKYNNKKDYYFNDYIWDGYQHFEDDAYCREGVLNRISAAYLEFENWRNQVDNN